MFMNEGGTGTGGAAGGAGLPPPPPPTGGTPPPPPPTSTSWTEKLTPEQKGYIENKGFKEPTDILNSYQNFEKLMGGPKEKLVRLPDKPDAPEWNDVYEKMGRPKDPKEYGLGTGEADDKDFAEWAGKTFHELGFSKGQAEKLINKWGQYYDQRNTQGQEMKSKLALEQETKLKSKWGNNFEAEMNVARSAAKAFGMPPEVADKLEEAIGYGATIEFLNSVGKKMGEGTFEDGNSGAGNTFALSPNAARDKLKILQADPQWTSNYLNGNAKEKTEMERLTKIIAGS